MEGEKSALQEEMKHIRAALGDLVVDLDVNRFPLHLRPSDALPDRDTYRRSLPRLTPPLSATIIEDRADRF